MQDIEAKVNCHCLSKTKKICHLGHIMISLPFMGHLCFELIGKQSPYSRNVFRCFSSYNFWKSHFLQ